MKKIQDAFYIDSKPYSELSIELQNIIDRAALKLKDKEHFILPYQNTILNIITTSRYTMLIQSEFYHDAGSTPNTNQGCETSAVKAS